VRDAGGLEHRDDRPEQAAGFGDPALDVVEVEIGPANPQAAQ